MEKFPINYQPGQRMAVLINKETGQPISVNPQPWPTEPMPDVESPFVEDLEKPIRIVKEFTFQIPKGQRMVLLRTLRKFSKVPRKLKKAAKHIARTKIGETTIEDQDGTLVAKSPLIHYAIEKGYPHTKWAKKSLRLIEWAVINYLKTQPK